MKRLLALLLLSIAPKAWAWPPALPSGATYQYVIENVDGSALQYKIGKAQAVFGSTTPIPGTVLSSSGSLVAQSTTSTSAQVVLGVNNNAAANIFKVTQAGNVVAVGSVTTSGAFFGDGSHLSGVVGVASVPGFIRDNFLSQVNGSNKVFTLSQAASTSAAVSVILDGLTQSASDYTFTAPTTVTMTTAPAAGSSSFFASYAINTSTIPSVAVQNQPNAFSAVNTFGSSLTANGSFTANSGIIFGDTTAQTTAAQVYVATITIGAPSGAVSSDFLVNASSFTDLNGQPCPASTTFRLVVTAMTKAIFDGCGSGMSLTEGIVAAGSPTPGTQLAPGVYLAPPNNSKIHFTVAGAPNACGGGQTVTWVIVGFR